MSKIRTPYWIWPLLAVPAVGMTVGFLRSTDPEALKGLLHPTGEFSARMLIIAMLATPLSVVLKGWSGSRWLVRNRRAFGVAAFGYAVLHVVVYLDERGTLTKLLADLSQFKIWTGWLVFLLFLPLALTSNDYSVRRLGTWWKPLQRWTYAAAALVAIHWAATNDWTGFAPMAVHFAPLVLLSAYRIRWFQLRARPERVAHPAAVIAKAD